MRPVWLLLVALAFGACATYREDLNRGQRLYEQNEFERSLAIWRYLEEDFDSLSYNDQARYAYLRGMTDYRLAGGKGGQDAAYRANARHWLALAKAIEQQHRGGLSEQWKQRLEEALGDLNSEVYGLKEPPAAPSAAPTQAPAQPAPSASATPAPVPRSTAPEPGSY
jgi:hypothetical protein